MKPIIRRRLRVGGCKLAAPGWNPATRIALEKLIRKGAGKGLPVVFDFDNTILRGDIHEATLAVLARSGRLSRACLSDQFAPSFQSANQGRIDPQTCADVAEYYNALLAPTSHGKNDPAPKTTGYAWAVELMSGLRVSDIVEATQEVCNISETKKQQFITVTPGKTAYPVPQYCPEMLDLLGELLRCEFDIWIISASNVWSVRWMVLRELNPRLRKYGQLAADHVIAAATLLADSKGRLYKDPVLVREHAGYAEMKPETLREFRLTRHLQFPLPAYSGKVACIYDSIGRQPYLGVGDGPADHAMLAVSQHRLWIARLDQAGLSQAQAKANDERKAGWMIQVSAKAPSPRFADHASSGWLFPRVSSSQNPPSPLNGR